MALGGVPPAPFQLPVLKPDPGVAGIGSVLDLWAPWTRVLGGLEAPGTRSLRELL